MRSGWKAGNLNVALGLESRADMVTALDVRLGEVRGSLDLRHLREERVRCLRCPAWPCGFVALARPQ
jgi:hypothetical protein